MPPATIISCDPGVVGLLSSLDVSFVDSECLAANLAGAPRVSCLSPLAVPGSEQGDA